eukprot:scaffold57968_cov61-Phaeocystis_antarctica.AAC.4
MAVWPFHAAYISAVNLAWQLLRRCTLAEACSSASTTEVWPCQAAAIRAVRPPLHSRFTLADASSNAWTMPVWPSAAACINAVRPSTHRTLTAAAEDWSSISTVVFWPRCTARVNA